ncbi:hypothetical protein RhiirC2_798951 [Rhizophagus irregularis]|uniref:Uncharacterized protein n=1 Tax=Rhizophagus irregularis TaxID=588596 RepID=A0A2N1M5S8_9GLOM|nr:hypothetical protein RhiirC2_798951 [Rhizophagus irregularis]
MKQEQPFLGVMRFLAFPWILWPFFARIAAHGLVPSYGICGKAQAHLEPAQVQLSLSRNLLWLGLAQKA